MNLSQRINILLVEDSDSDATLLLHSLQQSSWQQNVHRVPTGEDALAVLDAGGHSHALPQPDLILLDLKLPGMDGFDILHRVKSHRDWNSIAVIIVTSSALEQDIHRAMRLNADRFFPKPLNLEGYAKLVADIEEFLTAHRFTG